MAQAQQPAEESPPTAADIEAYRARVALTGIVTVANGPFSPAVLLRALAHLVAEDAMERKAIDDVREDFFDLQAVADRIEGRAK
jgi:hypothetical protein